MDTNNIVRRIIELKKVSVELKQSTQNPSYTNTDFVKSILKLGRQMGPVMNSTMKKSNNFNTFRSDTEKSRDHQNRNNSEEGRSLKNSKKLQRSDEQANYKNNSSLTSRSGQDQYLIPAQQVNQQKTDDTDLQEEILLLQEKLRKLQALERQQKQELWKDGIPYFVLHLPKAEVFRTRLNVSEKDYSKFDYQMYSVDLNLEKIIFSQLSQVNISSKPLKTFSHCISDLKEVKYYTSPSVVNMPFGLYSREIKNQQFVVIYQFKSLKNGEQRIKNKRAAWKSSFSRQSDEKVKDEENNQIVETVYIRFQNQEQLKEWDLGVFINFKIMEDSAKNNNSITSPFQQFDFEGSPISRVKSNEANQQSFRTILHKISHKSDKREGKSDTLFNKMEGKKSFSIQDKRKDDFKKTPILIQKLYSNIDTGGSSPLICFPNNDNESKNIKISDELQSPLKEQNYLNIEGNGKQRSDTSHFGTLVSIEDKNLQDEQKKIQTEQLIKRKVQEIQYQKKKEEEKVATLKKTEMELSFKKARQALKRGYPMVKYARMSVNPHRKRVFLSDDGKKLFWEDASNPKEKKFIFVSAIQSIKQGEIGKETQSYYNKDRSLPKGCYVTIHLNPNKQRKTLELSSKDQFAMEQFCQDLETYRQKQF